MQNDALADIQKRLGGVGVASREFEFAGQKITLRVLTVDEELQVRRELNAVLAENTMAIDYIYKLEALARALTTVNGVDLLKEIERLADKTSPAPQEKIVFTKNILVTMGTENVELLWRLYRALCDQVKLKLLKPFRLEDILTSEEQEEVSKLELIKSVEARRLAAAGTTKG